jgi:hypothetical protein
VCWRAATRLLLINFVLNRCAMRSIDACDFFPARNRQVALLPKLQSSARAMQRSRPASEVMQVNRSAPKAHDYATLGAMGERDYIAEGEVHVTEFFDHGGHAQMVVERFAPDGSSMGRSTTEDCRTGG